MHLNILSVILVKLSFLDLIVGPVGYNIIVKYNVKLTLEVLICVNQALNYLQLY